MRKPVKIQPRQHLEVLRGGVTDPDSLVAAFSGVDHVISCYGPYNHKEVGDLMSVGTQNIVRAWETNGGYRLVFMSGFMQSGSEEFSIVNRLAIKLLRRYYHESLQDKVIAEATIKYSDLNWAIVRAVALADKLPTGTYKAGTLVKVSPFNALAYADCAKSLLDAVDDSSRAKQIINVGKAK